MLNWYVAHTHAQGEVKSQLNLERQGFKTYLPRYMKERRHARRIDKVAMPLFKRYIFICMDITQTRWRNIQSTIGVQNLVCVGDTPAPIDESIIHEIRKRENEAGFVQVDSSPKLNKGDSIRVSNGPFSNLEGLFDAHSDSLRVTVLLNILGGSIRVKLPKNQVHPAR